jgi:hypothetical protein
MFYWFEPVLHLDSVAKFSETTEKYKTGFFVVFADNVGDVLTFKILKNDLSIVLHRNVVRSAADPMHRNKRVTFKSDIQETLDKPDTRPNTSFPRNTESNQRSTKPNDDISISTRSKAVPCIDRYVGNRIRSKVHSAYSSDIQSVNFHNKINISNKKEGDLQLKFTQCNVYQNAIHPKSHSQLENLRQLNIFDIFEDDKSWKCVKILKYPEEKYSNNSIQHMSSRME